MASLDGFLREQSGGGRRCVTCRLPEELLEQVEEARGRAKAPSYPLISQWLREEGHEVPSHSLKYHFGEGHQSG